MKQPESSAPIEIPQRPQMTGRVIGLWRYPVKSMKGEGLIMSEVTERGLVGDRVFGIIDMRAEVLLSAKRVPELLMGSAVFLADDVVELTLPDATTIRSDDAKVHSVLSVWLGREVELQRPVSGRRSLVEVEVDIDDPSQIAEFSTRPGLFHDGPVMHLLTTESLACAKALYPKGDWAVDRFRPNILIEPTIDVEEPTFLEDAWVGSTAKAGTAEFAIHQVCDRCVMVTRAVADLPADKMILRTLHRHHQSDFGVKSTVSKSGRVSVDDEVVCERTL